MEIYCIFQGFLLKNILKISIKMLDNNCKILCNELSGKFEGNGHGKNS